MPVLGFILLHMHIQLEQHHLVKNIISPSNCLCSSAKDPLTMSLRLCLWVSHSTPSTNGGPDSKSWSQIMQVLQFVLPKHYVGYSRSLSFSILTLWWAYWCLLNTLWGVCWGIFWICRSCSKELTLQHIDSSNLWLWLSFHLFRFFITFIKVKEFFHI